MTMTNKNAPDQVQLDEGEKSNPSKGIDMTQTTANQRHRTSPAAVLVCDYCGTPRESRRLSQTQSLKCANCELTTVHHLAGTRTQDGLVASKYTDRREEKNAEASARMHAILALEAVYTSLGVEIIGVDQILNINDRHCYYLIRRDRRDGDWWTLEISAEATPDGVKKALTDAIGAFTRNDALRMCKPDEVVSRCWYDPALVDAEGGAE